MKKLGLLVLALVLALGTLGVAYARWFDTVTINGTVNTGNVNINVTDYSGTWVYKDVTNSATDEDLPVNLTDEMWIHRGAATVPFAPPAGSFEVAHAVALPGQTDDSILVEFVNLFPCVDFTADFELTYVGSIPVKVNIANIDATILKADGITPAELGVDVDVDITLTVAGQPVPLCYQLHNGDKIDALVTIHILQTEADSNVDMMGASGTITGTVEVQQWNEDCVTPTPEGPG